MPDASTHMARAHRALAAALDAMAGMDVGPEHSEALDSAGERVVNAIKQLHLARIDFAYARKGEVRDE